MNKFSFKFSSFFLHFFIFFLLVNTVSAVNIEFNILENNIFKELGDGRYSLLSRGTFEIYNPSNISKIYEIDIPLELDSLVGINKVDLQSNSSLNSSSNSSYGDFEFTYERISKFVMLPNETVTVGYEIFGIVNYDLQGLISSKGISVFEHYAEDIYARSQTVVSLEKVDRSGDIYNFNQQRTINSTLPADVNSTRVVAVNLRNPTDYTYIFSDVKLYGTQTTEPMFDEKDMLKNFGDFSIDPFDYTSLHYYHGESNDYSVYWTHSNTHIAVDITSNSSWERIPYVSRGGGGKDNHPKPNPIDYADRIIVKKEVNKNLVLQGEEVEVTLTIVNLNKDSIHNLALYDEIPSNYDIKDVSSSVKIESGSKLVFDIGSIGGYETLVITYTLRNSDQHKGITYLKPAFVLYNDEVFYSEGVLLVNDLLPNKKIFIQKEIQYEDDDFARVTITVKNLGSVDVENILVSDIIDDNAIIREISQMFIEKGVWKIAKLRAGEEWVVTYLIERNPTINTLPNVFGVEEAEVYKTLIQSEEVITLFKEQPRTIETAGMALAVGLLIFYLLF